jgi:hypothetical protein
MTKPLPKWKVFFSYLLPGIVQSRMRGSGGHWSPALESALARLVIFLEKGKNPCEEASGISKELSIIHGHYLVIVCVVCLHRPLSS